MARFERITIEREKSAYLFNVQVDNRRADMLTVDEALGVVASVLFGGIGAALYVKTPEEQAAFDRAIQEGATKK
jgi:hypothetical protein